MTWRYQFFTFLSKKGRKKESKDTEPLSSRVENHRALNAFETSLFENWKNVVASYVVVMPKVATSFPFWSWSSVANLLRKKFSFAQFYSHAQKISWSSNFIHVELVTLKWRVSKQLLRLARYMSKVRSSFCWEASLLHMWVDASKRVFSFLFDTWWNSYMNPKNLVFFLTMMTASKNGPGAHFVLAYQWSCLIPFYCYVYKFSKVIPWSTWKVCSPLKNNKQQNELSSVPSHLCKKKRYNSTKWINPLAWILGYKIKIGNWNWDLYM